MATMTYARERFDFVAKCERAGMDTADAEAIARDANTVDLWAVRECNGEVEAREEACEERGSPVYGMVGGGADSLPHRVLKVPAGAWLAPHNINGPGPIWYSIIDRPTGPQAERRIAARVLKMGAGWAVRFNGDPRGSVVCVTIPGVLGNCGDGEWVYVPTRSH